MIWGSGATGAPTTTIANTVDVNSITRNITGAPNWIIGGGATAGVLNVGTINNTLGNVIIRNLSATGLSVNVTNVNAAGGILYFGAASSSQPNSLNNLTVSGTFSIGGTASVNVNIDNATDNYSLGLLSMASGTIALNQSNNGTNKQYVANVTGLTGAGGIIQGYGTSTQGSPTNSGTVAINNSTDFVSGALIRRFVNRRDGRTVVPSKIRQRHPGADRREHLHRQHHDQRGHPEDRQWRHHGQHREQRDHDEHERDVRH